MSDMTKIIYNGRLAAVVLADQAILTDSCPSPTSAPSRRCACTRSRSPPANSPAPTPTRRRSSTPTAPQRQGAA